MKHPFNLVLSATALALIALSAQAQDATELEPIVLQSEEDPTGPVVGYAAGTSASVKSDRSLLETPSSVTVITTDQIEDTGANNLSEALGYTAGVVTEAFGADPRFDSISVRGADLQNQIYLNGLRYRRSTRPDFGAPSLDLYGLERVELLRGPNSVLYGAGSPAGLVNLIQKRAQFYDLGTEVGAHVDSNGSYYLFGDTNQVVNDQFAYRLVGKIGNRVLEIEEYDNEGGFLGFSAKYLATPSTTIEFLGSYQKDDPDSPSGVPNGLIGEFSDEELHDFYFGNESLENGDRQVLNLGFQVTHEFAGGWQLINNTGFTKFDWDYRNLSVGDVIGTLVDRTLLVQDEDVSSFATDFRVTGEVPAGSATHRLTFGLDASRFSENASSIFYFDQEDIDFEAPNYDPIDANFGGFVFPIDKDVTVEQIGIYARDEVEFSNWRASLALRHDWNKSDGDSVTPFATTDLTRDDSETTGQASLAYVWDNGVSAYVSYGTSFSVFAEPDAGGNVLEPTTGEQWELGMKYLPETLDAYLTAAVYQLDERNRATTTTVGGIPFYSQTSKSRIRGFELEGRAHVGNGWNLTGGYSYTDSEIIGGDNDGNELGLTPRNTFKLWASKELLGGPFQGLTVGAGVRHIGERFAFNANDNKLDSVTLFDAAVTYEFENGTEFQLNVTNISDEIYVSSVGFFSTYFGDGRTISATLTREW